MTTRRRSVMRLDPQGTQHVEDLLAAEAPLEIRLRGVPIAVLMRTPGFERELIRGFAITEGLVLSPHEIGAITSLDSDRWELEPADGIVIDPEQFRRNLYASSSCGVCGKASIDAVRITAPSPPSGPVIWLELLFDLMERLRARQPTFEDTGGLHAAGIFDPDGTPLAVAEDVGRHNAVDKAIGTAALHRWPLGEVVLVVSGRSSFEVVQKAVVAGIPVVAGVSAVSSLAAELGDEMGITVVGFVRHGSAVVYSGSQRFASVD